MALNAHVHCIGSDQHDAPVPHVDAKINKSLGHVCMLCVRASSVSFHTHPTPKAALLSLTSG